MKKQKTVVSRGVQLSSDSIFNDRQWEWIVIASIVVGFLMLSILVLTT